jgi:hypothetical protein
MRLLLAALALPVASASAGELRGSHASMVEQHEIARENDFTFLRTPAQIQEFVAKERLVEVTPNADLLVSKVSFPYTRPAVKLFIERLAAQFHRATGDVLVVTSLTRPTSMQPRNASPLSVHPAGMAVDFRVPATAEQRAWLEQALLELEGSQVLDATRERNPPHYHVAVFPEAYQAYVDKLLPRETAEAAARSLQEAAAAVRAASVHTPPVHVGIPAIMLATFGIAALIVFASGGLAFTHARR